MCTFVTCLKDSCYLLKHVKYIVYLSFALVQFCVYKPVTELGHLTRASYNKEIETKRV